MAKTLREAETFLMRFRQCFALSVTMPYDARIEITPLRDMESKVVSGVHISIVDEDGVDLVDPGAGDTIEDAVEQLHENLIQWAKPVRDALAHIEEES